MQKKFLKWLFLVVLVAFLLTLGTSYYFQTNQSEKTGINLIRLKIEDVKHQLKITETNLKAIKQMTDKSALVKAHVLAFYIEQNPNALNNRSTMEKMRKMLDVDEIHISDGRGILIFSIPQKYQGMSLNKSAQSRAFVGALTNKKFEFVQEPRLRAYNDGIFQYAGVARLNRSGLVQIGFEPKRLYEAQKIADIRNISAGFRVGQNGNILVIKDGKLLSKGIDRDKFSSKENEILLKEAKIPNKTFKIKLDGKKYICVSEQWKDYVIVGTLPESEMYLSRNSVLHVLVLVNVVLFAIIFFLIYMLLQNVVISNIWKVNKSLNRITEGNLEEKVEVRDVKEFELLSDGINTTVDALKQAIDAEAKRLDEELELAKSIQHSALPNVFPPYPEHKEFDIYATMFTAREVGGDFYDFFFVDPEHFAFVIADVSGKGIPAALFMMTSKTLLKNLAKTGFGINPDKLMKMVNHQLCKANSQKLFVTVFMCVVELKTGRMVCVNAGHNPPLIKSSDGSSKYFKAPVNLVVGAMDNLEYQAFETHINKGDCILLYTDGVTEALNKKEEFYGDEKLKQTFEKIPVNSKVEDVLKNIKDDVVEFMDGAQQADDITMLAFKYNG